MLELSLVAALVLGILVFVACNRADRAKDFAAAGPGLGMQFSDDLPEGTAAAIRAMPSVALRRCLQSFSRSPRLPARRAKTVPQMAASALSLRLRARW